MVTAVILLASSLPAQPTPAETAWTSTRAFPIETVEAGRGFADLEPLRERFAAARVIGLGESTHGTREHFQMKHRLVEFLASELGFTIFSIEASSPESFRVDEYVSQGKGDPAALIGGMYFWTWNTEEVLAMVEWMKGFNERERAANSGKSIRFTGFDMQEESVAKEIVRNFVANADAEFLPQLDKHWTEVGKAGPGGAGAAPFATATGTLPIDKAKGRKVTLKGFIKTQNVAAHAGLWMRVDGPPPENAMLAFDNMHERGPKGNTEWTEYSVTLDVPPEAVNINFGCIMPGVGQAWFDSLSIEIDGVPYAPPAADLDLSFDGEEIKGFTHAIPGYDIMLDGQDPHAGDGALFIRSTPEIAFGAAGAGAKAVTPAKAVLDHLRAKRDGYLKAGKPAKEVDWAIHNADIVHQWARLVSGNDPSPNVRDECMAANVMWLLEQDPDAKIVLWAHNMHMSRIAPWQGNFLRKELGDKYIAVGFAAGEGQYYAMPAGNHDLTPAPPHSVESIFEHAGFTIAGLDLSKAGKGVAGCAWVFEPRPIRTLGALANDKEQFGNYIMDDAFDVLIYTKETTAARQLKTPPGPMK